MTAADPFAHLHDEDYARDFSRDWVGWRESFDPAGRASLSLDGDWRLTLDPYDEGLRQHWYALDDASPERWTVPRDYDPDGAKIASVPSCWNLLEPEWKHYEGAVWYAREFDHAGPAPDRAFVLRFGAANYAARVFLNGVFLGAHRGGSTPFCLDAKRALRAGANRLMVHVENRRRDDRVPMSHFDWFNYGGLHRSIALFDPPARHIRRFSLSWRDGAIDVAATLSRDEDATLGLSIPELGIAESIRATGGIARARISARPEFWSPDRPKLYDVALTLGEDRCRERIGFREIRVDGTQILLNGAPIKLKGACVHEDDVARGRCTDDADVARRLRHVKELGGNFLRLAHYPHDERVARAADAAGILLWAEIPVYWAIDFANPDTYADAENQLLELIARDANRASAILWGVGNENADTDARLSFMTRLATAARQADPTRLVSAACLVNRKEFRIEDRLAASLDVIGLNEYFGWYEPDARDLARLLANSDPGKPVLISETGADALAGLRANDGRLFSEEKQGRFYVDQLAILRCCAYVQGLAAWLLYDFRSERRQTRFQRGWNRKGLIAEDKATKKLAFTALRDAWRDW
jgi:beta-glucuronidase